MAQIYTYEFECLPCGELIFEVHRPMAERNAPATCPKCGNVACSKIMSRTHFNEIFPGSTKREALADHWTRESIKAQSEGFSSKDEIQTAIGLSQERAKQMGQPDKQLIGPVKTPFEGPKYKPTQEEIVTADVLVKREIRAQQSGDAKATQKAAAARLEHEGVIRRNAAQTAQKFRPKNTAADHKRQIKLAQEARRA